MEIDVSGLEVLSRAECLSLLAGARVGRVVVTDRALPAAFPVSFALLDGDVVFPTRPGGWLEAATAGQVVAFEVDDIDPVLQTGWSVLIQGEATLVEDVADLARARSLPLAAPAAPVHFVRLSTEIVSGRGLLPAHHDPSVGRGCLLCGCQHLLRVTVAGNANYVCAACAACWHVDGGDLRRVEPAACAGCSFQPMCSAALARDRLLASSGANG